jgi:hypothetical protein
VLAAGSGEADPDRRVVLMLAGRGNVVAKSAVPEAAPTESSVMSGG